MKSEQRLLLAFSLTAAVLFLWTFLMPPVPAPVSKTVVLSPEGTSISMTKSVLPALNEFKLGSVTLAIGVDSGGIHSLQVGGVQLLDRSNPGIFQTELTEPSAQPLRFETAQQENRALVSIASIPGMGTVTRTIALGEKDRKFIYNCNLRVSNQDKDKKRFKLRLVAFRPLYAATVGEQQYGGGFVSIEGRQKMIPIKPGRERSVTGLADWVSAQGKSHTLVLRPLQRGGMFHVEHSPSGMTGWLDLPAVELSPGESAQWNFQLYAGPMDLETLREAGIGEVVSLGAFPDIAKLLIEFMDWSKSQLGSYGLSICLLSFAVWLPFSPLTWYGTRLNREMMEKMGRVKPQEARIRKEHAKNPQRMQQELMELYKKSGINPASGCIGCLPMLLSMPIYIALFQVLNRAPQLRGAKFLWIRDLAAPDALIHFPKALPLIGESFNLLPIIAVAGMFVQQRMMKPPQDSLTDDQKTQQQMFMFMPLMLLFFFYNLPSGFVLYWVINSGLMTGQQSLIKSIHRT